MQKELPSAVRVGLGIAAVASAVMLILIGTAFLSGKVMITKKG